MERLTERSEGGKALPMDKICKDVVECINELSARCAAYEETGLEPEEVNRLLVVSQNDKMMLDRIERIISELGSLNHLRDLLTAEQDGRMVVLPTHCKDCEWRDEPIMCICQDKTMGDYDFCSQGKRKVR